MDDDNRQIYDGEVVNEEDGTAYNAEGLMDVIKTVVLAVFSKGTPVWTKILSVAGILYLLIPYDLLPGAIDDAVIVPLIFSVAWKFIPDQVKDTVGANTDGFRSTVKKHKRRAIIIGIILVLMYTALIGLIIWSGISIANRNN